MQRPPVDPSTLLEWADANRRDLPWRATRDPWSIHVSEVMLQQTQVDRVVPKYHAFLDRFPTVGECAAGDAAGVIRLWDGLGYNRRALNLHRAACMVVADFDGRYPTTLAELLSLPGVGPYTGRAIMTFAYEADTGVVDTNVGRTLARLVGRKLDAKEAQTLADDLVPDGLSWVWNQAMFDLGAQVCGKRNPTCEVCPLFDACGWQGNGDDPAVASAGVSAPQSRFDGSDRQGRGKLVRALRSADRIRSDAGSIMGWPEDPERTERVVAGLLADGMVIADDEWLRLPRT